MTTRTIAIWTAVSSDEQAKRYSLDTQLQECQGFVAQIPTRYPGDTATIIAELSLADTRSIIEFSEAVRLYPASYGMLETLIKQHKINVLLCVRRDRLGREASLIMTIEALCRKHKVKVVALKSGAPSTLDPVDDEGSGYVVAIEAETARVEVRRLQDRRASGMAGRVREEQLFPNNIPWGYSYRYNDSGEIAGIVLDPAAKAFLRRIFIALYLIEGHGLEAISKILDAEGSQTPKGKRWRVGHVSALFRLLDRYAGWIEYNRQSKTGKEHIRVRGNYEPVISEDELKAIRAQRQERMQKPQHQHTALSGVVLCAACGKAMYHNYRRPSVRSRRVTSQGYLYCHNRDCTEQAYITDWMIINALYESVDAIKELDENDLIKIAAQQPVDIRPAQQRLDALVAEQKKLYEERRRSIRAFVTLAALTDDEFTEITQRIDNRLLFLDDEIATARTALEEDQNRNRGAERVRQFQQLGREMLDRRDEEAAKVNQWLRLHVRVYARKGARADAHRRIEVHFI